MVQVRATPNASRDAIEGVVTDAAGQSYLSVRVRAVPEKGKANAAVALLLAKAVDAPKSAVAVIKGDTHRLKTVAIATDEDIAERLEKLAGGNHGG